MGRGPVVQARKDAVNAQKGKIFSLHAKLVAVAASKGGDPDKNPALAGAIYTAKKAGVPNDNIDRAIKKGTGEDKSGAIIEEVIYEGYGPGGVAVMISTLTDNKNRTVSNIRHIFSKYSGNMGESGVVSWIFKRKGVIFVELAKYDYDRVEELVFNTEAEDISAEDTYLRIITNPEDLIKVEKYLEDNGIETMETKLDFIPDNEVEINDFEKALKFTKMLEAFEEDEDVNIVSSNEIILPSLQGEVDSFIEKNTFKT